jgi:hypothetical protein
MQVVMEGAERGSEKMRWDAKLLLPCRSRPGLKAGHGLVQWMGLPTFARASAMPTVSVFHFLS